jgi:DNA mismatch repair protein MutS
MASTRALAVVDVLASFAELALSKDWARPVLKENGSLEIKSGRHPVVEDMLPEGEFVPNDIHLDDENQQVMIITGPNMAGKSTILRQTALIVLLAQTGSFVPAESARIPLTDRIFTRVGAMDDLAGGRSTFMVEMTETSRILEQATFRSLVILDEIGRGTSTYDGLSIAWAVAEHLHNLDQKGVKTLFATHYHELTDLAGECPRVKNYNVAAKEYQGGIVFLRKLKPGGVSRSYGLQVAKLAGLPQNVLKRAQDILNGLEKDGRAVKSANQDAKSKKQLPLFEAALHPVLKSLKELDTDNLTPVQALSILDEMKRAVS